MNNGKICVSVCAENITEFVENIKRAAEYGDIVELRFDCLPDSELKKTKLKLPDFSKKFLVTFRSGEQGGKQNPTFYQRLKFWEKLFWTNQKKNYLIDAELDIASSIVCERITTIVSSHHFENPGNPHITYQLSKINEENIIKTAIFTKDITDTIEIWRVLEIANTENRKFIPIAMGESGKWTRILGLAHGAFMTYAALEDGKETAPGQVSARDLVEVYRAKELDETTEIYGILGSNTSASMSPYIHNAAFKFHKLNAVFVPLQAQNLDEFIKRMVREETREINLNFKGFAVTIPHKENINKHLDFIDKTAKKIGAVNTVKIVDGKLYGCNTDAEGFIQPLLISYSNLKNAKAAVIGAGGAARACIYALKQNGAEITIFARDLSKAEALAEEFKVQSSKIKVKGENYGEFDILVNTTPLGMKGKADGETPATAEQLKGLDLVYDLVYVPFQTPLMKEADIAEVPKIGGLAMLIEQAAAQQKIWTGLDAPIQEMSAEVLRKLR